MFAVEVESRDSEIIKNILENFVENVSIVLTDSWKAYDKACKELESGHQKVNHSKNFKDPETGIHTNTIEGCNNGLKTLITPRNRNKKNIKYYLLYYIWRRQNKKNIWEGFMNASKNIVILTKFGWDFLFFFVCCSLAQKNFNSKHFRFG